MTGARVIKGLRQQHYRHIERKLRTSKTFTVALETPGSSTGASNPGAFPEASSGAGGTAIRQRTARPATSAPLSPRSDPQVLPTQVREYHSEPTDKKSTTTQRLYDWVTGVETAVKAEAEVEAISQMPSGFEATMASIRRALSDTNPHEALPPRPPSPVPEKLYVRGGSRYSPPLARARDRRPDRHWVRRSEEDLSRGQEVSGVISAVGHTEKECSSPRVASSLIPDI